MNNPLLVKGVSPDSPLKEMFVDYVGNKLQPENGEVTVEMIVNVLSEEFPDFLIVIAEENWLRGYEQALEDVESMKELS